MNSLERKETASGATALPAEWPEARLCGTSSEPTRPYDRAAYFMEGLCLVVAGKAVPPQISDTEAFSSFLKTLDEIDLRRFATDTATSLSNACGTAHASGALTCARFLDTLVGQMVKRNCTEPALTLPLLDSEISLLSSLDDTPAAELARALYRKGDLILAGKKEDRRLAVDLLSRSADLYRRAGSVDNLEKVLPLISLSHEARLTGDLVEADRRCHQIESLLPGIALGKPGAKAICAAAHYSCGKTRLMLFEASSSADTIAGDDLQLAHQHLEDAISLLDMEPDSPLKGRSHLWYGKSLHYREKTYDAIKYINIAEQIFRNIGDTRYVLTSLDLAKQLSEKLTGQLKDKMKEYRNQQ